MAGAPGPLRLALLLLGAVGRAGPRPQGATVSLSETVQKWREYRHQCQLFLTEAPPPATGLFCNRTFDDYACWPDGLPGSFVNVSCPWYLPWANSELPGGPAPVPLHHLHSGLCALLLCSGYRLGHSPQLQTPALHPELYSPKLVCILHPPSIVCLHQGHSPQVDVQHGCPAAPVGWAPLLPGFSGLPPGVPAHAVLRGGQLLLAPGGRRVPVHTAGPLSLLGATRLQALPDHRLGCWTRNSNMNYWLIIRLPILFAIGVNFLIFIRVICIVVSKLKANLMCKTDIKCRLAKSTLTLIPLLGTHEVIFAFVMDEHARGTLRFIKLLTELSFTSFQGLMVAILYCFVNSEVQMEFRKSWERWRLEHLHIQRDSSMKPLKCPTSSLSSGGMANEQSLLGPVDTFSLRRSSMLI
ncbi:glucagon-like peptide 1 receptor isoform X2 [Pteropus medius]|uniref:glucagon-like peptide 1 receptor isoform X2 n=1 Tax=Pteropus vampyrus TaxID=132908 RepID=UPI00196A9FF7|nr:glucagon-like peptide 1 receptor isoform X2 [Pteropus giganteus]